MDQQRIAQCVELLCQEGCTDVRATIIRIETKDEVPQLLGMSADERLAVLAELKAIMAVYDRR